MKELFAGGLMPAKQIDKHVLRMEEMLAYGARQLGVWKAK
jgi:hypothetical protein